MGATPVLTSMMAIGTTATVAGTYMSYRGAKKAGKQQQQANEFNAKVAERNAKVARVSKEIQKRHTDLAIDNFVDDFEKFQASSAQAYRVNGFQAGTGTPLVVAIENAYEAEKEIAMQKYNSRIREAQLEETAIQGGMSADLSRMYGEQARTAGKYNAYSSLLGGASQLAGMGMQYSAIS